MVEAIRSNNPVTCLYLLLEEARKKNAQWGVGHVWADVFGINVDDRISLYLFLAKLIELANEAQVTVELLDDPNNDKYLVAFDKVDMLLSLTNLDQQWGGVREKHLDQMTMYNLELAARVASVQTSEVALHKEELKELQGKVEELIDELADTAFPDELKNILKEKLEEIRMAIIIYRIGGLKGLRQAFEAGLGATVWRYTEFKAPQDKKTSQWREKFGTVLANIGQAAMSGTAEAITSTVIAGLLAKGGS